MIFFMIFDRLLRPNICSFSGFSSVLENSHYVSAGRRGWEWGRGSEGIFGKSTFPDALIDFGFLRVTLAPSPSLLKYPHPTPLPAEKIHLPELNSCIY